MAQDYYRLKKKMLSLGGEMHVIVTQINQHIQFFVSKQYRKRVTREQNSRGVLAPKQ